MKPQVQLIIPQLFSPLPLWEKDFAFSAKAKFLSKLLSTFDFKKTHHSNGLDTSIFASLGLIDKELPNGVYRSQSVLEKILKTRGGVIDEKQSKELLDRSILCADPVHLQVGMNDITLTEAIDDLSQSDSLEIIEALNDHFKQDGIEFFYSTTNEWYLSIPYDDSISTTPLSNVLRKNIANYLPTSKNKNWQMIQNEAQMLLHSLSINKNRELEGLVPVNSLWFWGGGELQEFDQSLDAVYSQNSAKGKMLANAAKCSFTQLNDNTEYETIISKLKGKSVFILDSLEQSAILDDIDSYQSQLTEIDQFIIQPLLLAWQAGELDLLIDGCDGKVITPLKTAVWKFWGNKPMTLPDIAKLVLSDNRNQ